MARGDKKHFPCGHWHKKKRVSTATTRIGIAPQWGWASDDSENGIGLAFFDVESATWTLGGVSLGGSPTSSRNQTLRISEDFSAYYGAWYQWGGGDVETIRLHIFSNDGSAATTQDLWTYEAGVNTYTTGTYNLMDIGSSGLIACMAHIGLDSGVTKNTWAIKVSVDKGTTWKPIYYFTGTGSNSVGANVRIDKNENVWVSIADYASSRFYIYKSTDKGDSWSNVCTQVLSGALPRNEAIYTINDDATIQYLYLSLFVSGITYEYPLYKSTDSGVSWSIVANLDIYHHKRHSSNGSDILFAYHNVPTSTNLCRISNDSGANWTDIVPPKEPADSYCDQQRCGDNIVYVETSTWFMYSLDKGITWKSSVIPYGGDFSNIVFDPSNNGYCSVDITSTTTTSTAIYDDEPQIWSMPSGQHY